jgi:hypothetical protein
VAMGRDHFGKIFGCMQYSNVEDISHFSTGIILA